MVEATVFGALLKWMRYRDEVVGEESPDRELSEVTRVSSEKLCLH